MPDVSEDMIRAVFAEDSEPDAILLTFAGEDMGDPILLTSWNGRISPGRYGLVSNGDEYLFAPFTFKPGGAGQGEPSRTATLDIENADFRITEALRSLPSNVQPTLDVATVRVAAPDDIEEHVQGATITGVKVVATTVTVTFEPRDFDAEPACKASYLPSTVPGLF